MPDVLGVIIRYALISLAVIVVLVLGYNAFSASSTQTAESQISTMANNVQTLYASTTFAGLGSTSGAGLYKAGALPSSVVQNQQLGTDPWGGAITIVATSLPGGGADSGFSITYPNVAQDACVKLAMSINGYAALTINGGTQFVPGSNPATVASAEAACTAGNTNSMAFIYGH